MHRRSFIRSHFCTIKIKHTQELCSSLASQPSLRHCILSGDGVVKVGAVANFVQVCFGDDGARCATYQRKLQLKQVRAAIAAVVQEGGVRQYVCLFAIF